MPGIIVHEWISKHGGSENVVDAMATTFPDAEIRCLWNDAPNRFVGRTIKESWLARTPLRRSKVMALPFMPSTWAHMDMREYDFVLVSSHLFAHHVGGQLPPDGPQKYVYVHTPARYIWAPELDRRGNGFLGKSVSRVLQSLDAHRATQGAILAANSEFVRDRIRDAWHRDATVIYPPVNVSRLQSGGTWRDKLDARESNILAMLPSEFLFGASRFVPYKRLDVVIRAGEASGLPVVLAGAGPYRAELASAAARSRVPVTIVDNPSDELLYALYQAALAFVFPAVEDFGIMPVEAMSLGTPVLVSSIGGARESVLALSGGALLNSFDETSLRRGVDEATSVNMDNAIGTAKKVFGEKSFSRRLCTWMNHEPGRPTVPDKPDGQRT